MNSNKIHAVAPIIHPVIPLHDADGDVIGVPDIDSPLLGRFTEADRIGPETFAGIVEAFAFSD